MKKAILLILLFTSCFYSQAQKFDSILANHYKIKDFDAAIFPKEFVRYDDTNSIDKKFTPSVAEILIAYKALKDSIMSTSNDTIKKKGANGRYHWNYLLVELLNNFNSYKWQFYGYINNKGEKKLSVVSFLLDKYDNQIDWLWTEKMVSDGGCEFWQAEYNLNTHKIILFKCNLPGG